MTDVDRNLVPDCWSSNLESPGSKSGKRYPMGEDCIKRFILRQPNNYGLPINDNDECILMSKILTFSIKYSKKKLFKQT